MRKVRNSVRVRKLGRRLNLSCLIQVFFVVWSLDHLRLQKVDVKKEDFYILYGKGRNIISIILTFRNIGNFLAIDLQSQAHKNSSLVYPFLIKNIQKSYPFIISYNKQGMGLEIDSDIFRWLQGLHIIKQGKRTPSSAIQISQHASSKLFDGLYISRIVKILLKERGTEDAITRLDAIKENSTPAIRLYNWNLLSDALKLLGYSLDYGEKSKLLNLQAQSLHKILKFLYNIRPISQLQGEQKLSVETSTVGQKSYKQAANIFEFLIISIGNHFKLSVQHTLNLFLDDNKYLAHLLVKGVKNEFQPVLNVLDDLIGNISFIVETLFCVDEKESVTFLFNAIKPCLISKSSQVAEKCLQLLKETYETYIQKGITTANACEWMEKQGINTMFFAIKRHSQLFQDVIAICYAYLQDKLFKHMEPQEKSLLWNNQTEKLSFFRELFTSSHALLLEKFLQSPVFADWNKYCLKALKKNRNTQDLFLLIAIYQAIWVNHQKFFEENDSNLPNSFISFLKSCCLMPSEIVFVEASRALFHLLVFLGISKKTYAPIVYKTLLSVLGVQDHKDRVEFMLLNFNEAFRSIPTLPATPLAEHIVKHLQSIPSVSMVNMAKIVFGDLKLKQEEAEDVLESLAKILFEDIQLGSQAVDSMMIYLNRDSSAELLDYYCKAALGQFVSLSKQLFRTIRELKHDYDKYKHEQSMKRGEASFLRNMHKYLIIANLVHFLQQCLLANRTFKTQAESMIFHTYLKLSKQMRKEHIAKILLPLLESYYQDEQLQAKIKEYENDLHQSIVSPPHLSQSEEASQIFQTPSPKKHSRVKEIVKTESNQSEKKETAVVESVRKQLEQIKKKRELQREKSIEMSREQSVLQQKQQLYRSMVNEKRIIQFGKKHEADYDYKNLLEFDSVKPQGGNSLGWPNIKLLNLQQQEEESYTEDAQTYLKKYRKVWRFLFNKYSSLGAIRPKDKEPLVEEKINMIEVWKMLKDYEFDIVKRQESQTLIRKVNEAMKRKHDSQNLTYLGFQDYLLQLSCFAYSRAGYSHIPPARQLALFLQQIRSVTGSKGASTEMFQNPDEVYFQQTEVIREFNRRLSENPDYVLPEGYKKIRQSELGYTFQVSMPTKGLKKNYCEVLEVLNELLWQRMRMHILQPKTFKIEKCLARPALFQKLKEKMKDYTGGYLMPKRSADLSKLNKEVSPMKVEYHLMPNFSLGIKLGLSEVDLKLRYIADEVAYWMDDVLDAVQAGKTKVTNKAKAKIENELIRRKRSEAYQAKLQNIQLEKRERQRAETVKNSAKKYVEDKEAIQAKRRQEEKKQKHERKAREEKDLKRKLQEFQQAKAKLEAKRRQMQQKKQAEIPLKKKQKEEYKKNVEEYFKKKKEELQQKEKTLKANRQWDAKQQAEKKIKEIDRKKRLQIEIFRKEEEVLQKIVEKRQSYQEIWRSPDIQEDLQVYRPSLKLLFDLLLRYQKSKISSTAPDQIGFNTINFFALRTYIAPFLLPKNSLALMFRSSVRGPGDTKNGLNYIQFQEFLFKIAVKAKDILNKRKNGNLEQASQVRDSSDGLPSLKSSPQLDRKKKSLTDQYALDAIGVEPQTLKRLMDFIVLPFDKQQAEQRFRTMLENTSSLPTSVVLKQAQNFLDSIP